MPNYGSGIYGSGPYGISHPIGPLISFLLRRVRDPQGLGTTRDLARLALSHSQRVINAKAKYVLTTETLATFEACLIYPIKALLPNSARIIAVRDDDRDLDYEPQWRNLVNLEGNWFRHVSFQHRIYSMIGRDLLVLYPAKDHDSTVEVVSVKLLPNFASDSSTAEIPNSDEDFLLDIAELILTIKNRNLPVAESMLKSIQGKMALL